MQTRLDFCLRLFNFIFRLQVHPVASAVAKEIAQSDRGIGCDGALAEDNLIDAPGGYIDGSSKLVLAQAIRL